MGERVSTVAETPSPPEDWEFMFDEPFNQDGTGWVVAYECIRNGVSAEMTVIWKGPGSKGVDILVDEFPDSDKNGESDQIFDLTVTKPDMREEINRIAETWAMAIDSES